MSLKSLTSSSSKTIHDRYPSVTVAMNESNPAVDVQREEKAGIKDGVRRRVSKTHS